MYRPRSRKRCENCMTTTRKTVPKMLGKTVYRLVLSFLQPRRLTICEREALIETKRMPKVRLTSAQTA